MFSTRPKRWFVIVVLSALFVSADKQTKVITGKVMKRVNGKRLQYAELTVKDEEFTGTMTTF